jgi:hypothetical protein
MKSYINKFPEIAHLPPQQQAELLERARVQAFVNMKLSGRSALYLFGSLLITFIPVVMAIWYFQGLSYVTVAVSAVSVLLHLSINHQLQAKLIRKGLPAVLSDTDVST